MNLNCSGYIRVYFFIPKLQILSKCTGSYKHTRAHRNFGKIEKEKKGI